MAVQQTLRLGVPAERVEDLLRGGGGGERHQTPREQLGVTRHVGRLPKKLPGALGAEPPDPGKHLVQDHGQAARLASLHQNALEQRVDQVHAPGAVQHALRDQRGERGMRVGIFGGRGVRRVQDGVDFFAVPFG